jgi:hypothetical protein
MSVLTDSPLSGAKAARYTSASTAGWLPASVMTTPPGVADEDRRAFVGVECLLRGCHVGFEADGGVLHDGDGVTVLGEQVVDTSPAGAIDETAVDEDDVPNFGHE